MNASSIQALVQAGFAAQQRGDTAAAEAAYLQALALQGEHPAALQLLGGLRRRQGRVAQAETLLRRSLAADARQPHVWNNLGNLLHAAGRSTEALPCFAKAVAQAKPAPYADAHYNQARVLHALGRLAEAAESLNAALRASPQPGAALLQLKLLIEADAGQMDAALATLERALSLAPDKPSLLHDGAVLLQRARRPAQALALHERAAAQGLDAAEAHYNRGNSLQSLGRHTEAAAAYRQALAREPAHALSLYDLARLRWRQGEADWDAELRAAIQAHPGAGLLAGMHGHLLWRAERPGEAAQAYRQALAAAPASPGLLDGLGRCLVRDSEMDAGLQAHEQAVAAAPQDAELHANHAASLLVAGRPQAALAAAEAACQLAPAHQQAQGLRVLALRLLGGEAAARAQTLCDVEAFVHVVDLPAPAGWPDMAAFNAALAAELRSLHADRSAPIDQTLRGGTQTMGDIFEQGHPLVDALKARIAQAVTAHVAALGRLAGSSEHPFLGRLPREPGAWRFTDSWSSRLFQQGFHTDHVHPHGWLSSAYYVAVPKGIEDHPQREGWLQLGRPDLPLPGVAPDSLVQRLVAPRPGRLVLFPSMLWHGTRPFAAAGERLTIAFDVVPA